MDTSEKFCLKGAQEELDDFITLDEEFQLKGLVGAEQKSEEEANILMKNHIIKPNRNIKTNVAAKTQSHMNEFPKEENDVEFESSPPSVGSFKNNYLNLQTTQFANILMDEDLKQNMENLIEQNGENWSCKVCGKVANNAIPDWKRNLRRHTQIHMEGLTCTCNLCGKEFRCKFYLDNTCIKLIILFMKKIVFKFTLLSTSK